MSKNELIARIEALNEWEAIIEEAQAQADAIRNSIKEELADRGVEELIAGNYIPIPTKELLHREELIADAH